MQFRAVYWVYGVILLQFVSLQTEDGSLPTKKHTGKRKQSKKKKEIDRVKDEGEKMERGIGEVEDESERGLAWRAAFRLMLALFLPPPTLFALITEQWSLRLKERENENERQGEE